MGAFLSNLGHGLADTGKLVAGVFDSFSNDAVEQRERARQQKNTMADQEFAAGLEALKNTAVNLQRAKDSGNAQDVDKYSKLYAYEEESMGKLMKGDKNLSELFQQFGSSLKQHFAKPSSPGQRALPPPGQAPSPIGQAPGQPGQSGQSGQAPSATAQMAAQTGFVNVPPGQMDPQILAAAAGPTPEQKKRDEYRSTLQSIDEGIKLGYWDESEAKDLRREAYLKTQLGLSGTALRPEKTTDVDVVMKDGTKKAGIRLPDGRVKDLAGNFIDGNLIKDVKQKAKGSSARPTVIASDITDLKKAKMLQAAGRKFYDAESDPDEPKELDLDKIPQGMVLQAVELPGGVTRYRPRSIADKFVTIGGVQYAVNPLEGQELPQGAGTTLGPAKTPTTRTSPVTVKDAQGNYVQLPGVSTPATPGVTGRPAGPGPSPGARARALPPPAASSAPTPPAGMPPGSRALPGVPAGQANNEQNRATPVRIATMQIFGDPKNPSLQGLADYADLADDPKASARIAGAVRLARSAMLDAEKQGGHIGASAGPVSVSTGGLGQWVTTVMGVPSKLTAAQNNEMQAALAKMTPREREAFNAIMATYGTVAGLRALTKAGVAQANMANIEQEIPLIGFNTKDKAQFIDKLKRIGEEIQSGAVGVPQQFLDVSQVGRKLQELEKSSGSASGLPDSARKQLKEGQVTTFGNGQQWMLRGGQPVQIGQ